MTLAPVIDYTTARRRHIAIRLQHAGVTVDQMRRAYDRGGDQALADLWTRERIIADLVRLTGASRTWCQLYSTAELVEIAQRAVAHLMDAKRCAPVIDHPAGRRYGQFKARNVPA